jgi:hypothetical protein
VSEHAFRVVVAVENVATFLAKTGDVVWKDEPIFSRLESNLAEGVRWEIPIICHNASVASLPGTPTLNKIALNMRSFGYEEGSTRFE